MTFVAGNQFLMLCVGLLQGNASAEKLINNRNMLFTVSTLKAPVQGADKFGLHNDLLPVSQLASLCCVLTPEEEQAECSGVSRVDT